MTQEYVLAFMPGSQGRFLASIFWSLITNEPVRNSPQVLNSWHNEENAYVVTAEGLDPYTDTDYYNKLTWRHYKDLALYRTHCYPDWDKLASNQQFNNAKFIIIHLEDDDVLECLANEMFKNFYKNMKGLDNTMNVSLNNPLLKIYNIQFGSITMDELIKKLDVELMQDLIMRMGKPFVAPEDSDTDQERRFNFVQLPIPDNMRDRTLIINFKDLYKKEVNGNFRALNKMLAFTGANPRGDVIGSIRRSFETNYERRKELIQECMYKLNIKI